MKRTLFLLLLLQTVIFGCATCQLMVPAVTIDLRLEAQEKKLHNIKIQWTFSPIFSNEMITQYDKNRDGKLDRVELDIILQAKLDYLQPKNMLSSIRYSNVESPEATALPTKYKNFALDIKSGVLVFSYDANLQLELSHDTNLYTVFKDDEGYFTFNIREVDLEGSEIKYTKNLYLFTASLRFEDANTTKQTAEPLTPPLTLEKIEPKESLQEEGIQENLLKETMGKIKSLFSSIKDETNPLTYLLLLLFAYIYGVIHALGPGHGKTLVASYFLSNDRSYTKAFFISLAIGVVHTFSAFLLTLIIYYVVNTLLAQFLDDTVYFTTKISALIIIAIAIYLIYKKYMLYKKISQASKQQEFNFSATPHHLSTCGCSSCKVDKNSTDIALIISAGIIPCPGTTTIFIFALSMGLYYAGFISALVMSLGMSSVIFVSALLSTLVRKKALHTNDNLKKFLEFGSLSVILILGAILLFM